MARSADIPNEVVTLPEAAGQRPLKVRTTRRTGGGGGGGNRGGGGGGRGGGGDRHPPEESDDFPSDRYRVAGWVTIVAVIATFASLCVVYVVRTRLARDWQPIAVPQLLWASTALILLSSVTFHLARRALFAASTDAVSSAIARYRFLIGVTLALGLGFIATQIAVWRQLSAQGVYAASSPHRSFFYVLTGAHAIHVAVGVGALLLLLRSRDTMLGESIDAQERRLALTSSVGLYWHFMDGLWIFLFLLLFAWR